MDRIKLEKEDGTLHSVITEADKAGRAYVLEFTENSIKVHPIGEKDQNEVKDEKDKKQE